MVDTQFLRIEFCVVFSKAVNNIIDTIRSAKDILVAASELNVRIPSHVDLRARIEASLQTRISDAWTPWLDQLLRSIR